MRRLKKSCPALIALSSALIAPSPARATPFRANICPNKLAPNVAANIPKNQILCFFTSFSTVSLTSINKPDSSYDLIIFLISLKSSFKSTNVVVPDP